MARRTDRKEWVLDQRRRDLVGRACGGFLVVGEVGLIVVEGLEVHRG